MSLLKLLKIVCDNTKSAFEVFPDELLSRLVYPMLGHCNIGTAAGEAKCMKLKCFEHTICLLEPTSCATMAKPGYGVDCRLFYQPDRP